MIELENISKSYKGKFVLKSINLKIKENQTIVLIGPSGCGKSTLMRIITGLVKPDNGQVKHNGNIINAANLMQFRRKIGYVVQEGGLFPHLTVFDNISIMSKEFKEEKFNVQKRVEELCRLTKFPMELIHKYPAQLSGGQGQRVSLMRALMMNPEILLLDEPLGALDPLIRYDLQNDLKYIFIELNKTVIMVTHDLNEAVFFADEIVLMNDGEIVQKGTAKEFLNSPVNEFVSHFINAQRNNII